MNKPMKGLLLAALVAANQAPAGLVSYWKFDGNMNDSVGGNHGTAVNGVVIGATRMIGDGALALNGSNQYVNVGSGSSLNLTGAITISAWIRCVNIGSDNRGIYNRGEWNAGQSLNTHLVSGYPLWTNNGIEGGNLSNGTWYQVAKTYDGTTVRLYVNGKVVASGNYATGGASKPGQATYIGAEGYGGGRWFFGGAIDDVGVYDNATDAAGIALINGLGRTGGIGLDQLGAAQTLWAGSTGDTAVIGGATWQKVAGLTGSLGDWSGSVSGGDAVIVLDDLGNGIKVVANGGGAGPLDHFAISPISTPQTVGMEVSGIVITAKDANDLTVSDFTGTVTFGGTAGITGISSAFIGGVLGGMSLTPALAGTGLTFTVDDGSGHTGMATFDVIAAPIPQLISHWTFDSNMDDSVGASHGTAVNGAAIGATSMIGSGALALDGSNQYVNVGAGGSLNLTGTITISAWIHGNNIGSDNRGIYTRGDWNAGQSLLIHAGANQLWTNNGLEGGPLANGNWYQVAKTYDGTTVRLYVNGKQVASGDYAPGGANMPGQATYIGAEANGGGRWYFGGAIDDVGVFDLAANAAGIALIHGLGRTGGIGLDQLGTALALWAGNAGDTAVIGGATWQKVADLTGSPGDWSGSVAGADAVIVLDNSGGGIRVLTGPPSGNYASWAAAQVPPVTGGPDHVGPDGIPNLMLYALDLKLDGTNGSPGTLTNNVLVFSKRAEAVANGDVSYTIQASDDLGLTDTWHKVAPTSEDGTTIAYALPPGKARTFARLVVTQGGYAGP